MVEVVGDQSEPMVGASALRPGLSDGTPFGALTLVAGYPVVGNDQRSELGGGIYYQWNSYSGSRPRSKPAKELRIEFPNHVLADKLDMIGSRKLSRDWG